MPTITFSEQPIGTANPAFIFSNNVVYTTGVIVTDDAQPTSPVLAANESFDGPVYIEFSIPVSSVSFDVGYFDNESSTNILFIDADENVLHSVYNTGYGIETFSYSNPMGIAYVQVINTYADEGGFSLDTLAFSNFPNTPDVPSLSIAASSADKAKRHHPLHREPLGI
jgi:hypothetical protein